MQKLSTTEKTLLMLCSSALFGTKNTIPTEVNWQDVVKEAEQQAVLPTVFSCKLVPEAIRTGEARNRVSLAICNNMRVDYSHAALHKLLLENNVPYVVLKGCASASYYPNPVYRSMGDVDFLIAQSNIDKVDKILKEAGFTSWDKTHICHVVYRRDKEHLEMHFEPAGVPEGKAGEIVRSFLANVFDEAQIKTVCDFEMCLPSDFHHGLIILLHTVHHLLCEGVGLRHLCDWAVFVNHFSNEEFYALFEKKFTEAGLWRTAQLLTLVCIKYLGCNPKECVGTVSDDVLEGILLDILQGGNFGVKDEERSRTGMILSNRGKDGVGKKNYIAQFIDNLNHIIYTNWPMIRKLPLLLPFGWLFWGIRYEIRVLFGERKQLRPVKMVSDAELRGAIYKEFRLYEVE